MWTLTKTCIIQPFWSKCHQTSKNNGGLFIFSKQMETWTIPKLQRVCLCLSDAVLLVNYNIAMVTSVTCIFERVLEHFWLTNRSCLDTVQVFESVASLEFWFCIFHNLCHKINMMSIKKPRYSLCEMPSN